MYEAISAGHINIDLIPELFPDAQDAAKLFVPGRLIRAGRCLFSLGGSVGNTGAALSKLGVRTALAGRIGNDELGKMTLNLLREANLDAAHLRVVPGESSSYSVVLAPVGLDRIFLHNPGANDHFSAADMDFEALKGARLLHLGYPTAMRRMALDAGSALVELLRGARAAGMSTSLDFSYPDAEMIRFDWREILTRTLPLADMVFPSFEELMMLLHPDRYNDLRRQGPDVLEQLNLDLLSRLGAELIRMGAAVAAIKCGTRGYYLRTANAARLRAMGAPLPGKPEEWASREYFSHVYQVETVKSATGAGDTSIAGFLSAFLRGLSPADCLNAACAVGALCVTDYSGTGAIRPLDEVLEMIRRGWKKRSYSGCETAHFHYLPGPDLLEGQLATDQ